MAPITTFCAHGKSHADYCFCFYSGFTASACRVFVGDVMNEQSKTMKAVIAALNDVYK